MSLLEIIGRALLFIVIIPILAIVAAVWSFIVMSASVLLAPIVCIFTVFLKEPYTQFANFYKAMLVLASVPFMWLIKLINI